MSAGVIIAIDKPRQWTSFQVVNKLKWHLRRTLHLKKIKIGHAGTLDPLASGLLLVCVGSATKQIEHLQAGIKEYSGSIVIGASTPCFDLEQPIDNLYPINHITTQLIEEARQRFIGEIDQIPPSFSAVKVDGQRAYLAARDGQPPDIAPKKVTIYDFQLSPPTITPPPTNLTPPVVNLTSTSSPATQLYRNPLGRVPAGLLQLDFKVTCSKGTYIRSLARDFGLALDSGALLSNLRRTRIGDFSLNNAIPLDKIEETITPDNPQFSHFFSTFLAPNAHLQE